MRIIDEFKSFAIRGNVIDMAVGIIIGTAFGKIVSSLVNDIIMPPIGVIIGGAKFSELKLILKESLEETPAIAINYGSFIQVVFDFLLIALSVFFVIKAVNSFKQKKVEAPSAPPPPSNEEMLLAEIRDLLKNK